MLTLVNVLIVFFIILIVYQIILATKIVEGLKNNNNKKYKPYPPNALILAQQNAGNIEYLKKNQKNGHFSSETDFLGKSSHWLMNEVTIQKMELVGLYLKLL